MFCAQGYLGKRKDIYYSFGSEDDGYSVECTEKAECRGLSGSDSQGGLAGERYRACGYVRRCSTYRLQHKRAMYGVQGRRYILRESLKAQGGRCILSLRCDGNYSVLMQV